MGLLCFILYVDALFGGMLVVSFYMNWITDILMQLWFEFVNWK